MSLPELELSHLTEENAAEGVEHQQEELSQLAGSSAIAGVKRQEEEEEEEELSQLGSSSAGEGVDRQEEEPSQLAGSSAGDGVERKEEELSQLAGSAAGEGVEHQEEELSQLAGSSAGEGVERQEEDELRSPSAAAASPDTADRSGPELSQLAGSSAGDGVERQEEEDDLRSPSAAAAAPDTADRSVPEIIELTGSSSGERASGGGERQEVHDEILEADLTLVPVENNLPARVPNGPNPMAMRYVYAALFASMTIVAWIVRDIELPRFNQDCDGSHDCIAASGVLRISMGIALFFSVMFLMTVNTKKRYEFRNSLHSSWWSLKVGIFLISYGFATYAPSSWVQFYGMIAHFGAWLFLAIQFFSMTSLIMWVNGLCRVESNRERWAHMTYGLLPLHAAPVVLYLVSFVGLAFMYYWYAPYCKPTTGICISATALVVCLMFLISCARKVSGGYLAPGLMMAYVVLMCWTTIRSEPHTETCNKKTKHTTEWQNILSLVIAAVVIITSTYTVGKDSKCIQFSNRIELEDDVPYGYGFFHLVFASGAMFIGMLYVGWNAHRTMEKWTVDVSWASTKVRATSGLAVATCYILMLSSQRLWNLMLVVTSNSAPSANEARHVGAPVLVPQ